jgi:signal transduction histidine kinase/CheY-like chemotaxis protein
MPSARWERRWRRGRRAEDRANLRGLARVNGEPLGQLLHLGARALLLASGADRAGVWLSGRRRGEPGPGCAVQLLEGSIPEQWHVLDISDPSLRAALESSEPLRVDQVADEVTPQLGPLTGMHSVIWVPLRAGQHAVGLGMVGYTASPEKFNLNLGALQTLAEEIALSVQDPLLSLVQSHAGEDVRSPLGLFRVLQSDAAGDSVFRQIARAARSFTQAEFIALGEGNEPSSAGGGWDGSPGWFSVLRQESLSQLWGKVLTEGRKAEILGEEAAQTASAWKSLQPPSLNHIVAIPIEVRKKTRGVLMAGLTGSKNVDEVVSTLESYAMLASASLEHDVAREERSASEKVLRKMVQDSTECLLLIDGDGKILETSRVATIQLFAPWGRREGMLLEELFFPGTRKEVIAWRGQIQMGEGIRTEKKMYPAPVLQGALDRGGVARMSLRCEVAGNSGNVRRWLIHVEQPKSRQVSHEAEERLQAEMSGLLASIESGVLIFDTAGRILLASERLAAIFGMESRHMMELGTIHALIDHLSYYFVRPAETAMRWRDQILQSEEASWDEIELIHPSRRIVERFARPLAKPDGERLGWLEVYRDITGQRLIQSKMLQTEKMAALGQLVSGIAHELNNPLTSIQGYAQLLLSRRTAPERVADAKRISQEAERAARIVKNLLLFSRETKSERRAVHLNEVIERTLSLRAYELKLQNIEVNLSLDPDLPRALADAAQLQQVVLNLIVNAEQAIAMGRADETVAGHILIRTRRLAGDRLQLEVSDDGPGIPPEIISRIFDPFFTTKPPGIGTGLGLSIVYGIVQEHGGEVTADNLKERGATLSLELPAILASGFNFSGEEPKHSTHLPAEATLPAPDRKPAKKHILIVEDEPTVAELIAEVMSDEGHRVDILLDSRAALGRLEENDYSLVICDLKMPYVDGPSLYRSLVRRANPIQHKLLFVTGDTMGTRTLEFLKSSGLPYLAKPFLVEELKEAVHKALAAVQGIEVLTSGGGHTRAAGKNR